MNRRKLVCVFSPSLPDAPPHYYTARARRRAALGLVAGVAWYWLARYVLGSVALALVGVAWAVFCVVGLLLAHWAHSIATAEAEAEAERLRDDPSFQATRWNMGFTPADERDRVRRLLLAAGYDVVGDRWVNIRGRRRP